MARRPKRKLSDASAEDVVRVDTNTLVSAPPRALTMAQARKLVQMEMREAQSRIEGVFSRVDTRYPTRPVLVAATAPAQAQAEDTTASSQESAVCASCAVLQAKLNELQKQAAVHREERRAWQQFKSWWLNSLSKHQRRRTSANTSVDDVPSRPTRQDPISHMIADLDAEGRRIWEQAGVMSAVERLEESAEESEPALILTRLPPATPIVTPVARSRVAPDAEPLMRPPFAISTSPRKTAKPAPLIRTTQPRTPTVQPISASSAVGFVGGAPERNRHARRTMVAHECPDCALFYSHFDNRVGGASTERQACSRHRTTFQRATTPQGYWNIGFPTTQDAEEINQLARQQHQQART